MIRTSFGDLNLGESETITVSYTVVDTSGVAIPATATLTITGASDGPVLGDDSAPVLGTAGIDLVLDVLANDTGDDLRITDAASLSGAAVSFGGGVGDPIVLTPTDGEVLDLSGFNGPVSYEGLRPGEDGGGTSSPSR